MDTVSLRSPAGEDGPHSFSDSGLEAAISLFEFPGVRVAVWSFLSSISDTPLNIHSLRTARSGRFLSRGRPSGGTNGSPMIVCCGGIRREREEVFPSKSRRRNQKLIWNGEQPQYSSASPLSGKVYWWVCHWKKSQSECRMYVFSSETNGITSFSLGANQRPVGWWNVAIPLPCVERNL